MIAVERNTNNSAEEENAKKNKGLQKNSDDEGVGKNRKGS